MKQIVVDVDPEQPIDGTVIGQAIVSVLEGLGLHYRPWTLVDGHEAEYINRDWSVVFKVLPEKNMR